MPSKPKVGEMKMVLVLRGELRLTAGKMAVQAAHAAVMLVRQAESHRGNDLEAWLQQGQKKIALLVPTLDELVAIERRARADGILTAFVEDAGMTEVPPGTRTCLGLGPAPAARLDAITGALDLL
jgi:PTH2 family peptidyl-tRNA hydrolase